MDNEAISLPLGAKQDQEVNTETIGQSNNSPRSPTWHGYKLRQRKQ
jgi:hypothetical protein